MPAESDPSRNSASHASAAARKNSGEEWRPQNVRVSFWRTAKDRFFGRKGDHFVDFGNRFPEGGEFLRGQDGKPGVRTSEAKRPHGAEAHDRVAEPIGRAHDEAKG